MRWPSWNGRCRLDYAPGSPALRTATVSVPSGGPAVRPEILRELARVCGSQERLRFDYTGHDGVLSVRAVEPHRLVHAGRRWYLVAWDLDRQDWRTFRVDRLEPRTPTGPRYTPRTPGGEATPARSVSVGTKRPATDQQPTSNQPRSPGVVPCDVPSLV